MIRLVRAGQSTDGQEMCDISLATVLRSFDVIINSIKVLERVDETGAAPYLALRDVALRTLISVPVLHSISTYISTAREQDEAKWIAAFGRCMADIASYKKNSGDQGMSDETIFAEVESYQAEVVDNLCGDMSKVTEKVNAQVESMKESLFDWKTAFVGGRYQEIVDHAGKDALISGVKFLNGKDGIESLDGFVETLKAVDGNASFKDRVQDAKKAKEDAQKTRDKAKLQVTIRSACALIINKDSSGVEFFYGDAKHNKVTVPADVKNKFATLTAE